MHKAKFFLSVSFSVLASAAYSEPLPSNMLPNFHVLVRHGEAGITSLNVAVALGEDSVVFTSLADDQVDWNSDEGAIRTGRLKPGFNRDVTLGACAGGNCDIGNGFSLVGVR